MKTLTANHPSKKIFWLFTTLFFLSVIVIGLLTSKYLSLKHDVKEKKSSIENLNETIEGLSLTLLADNNQEERNEQRTNNHSSQSTSLTVIKGWQPYKYTPSKYHKFSSRFSSFVFYFPENEWGISLEESFHGPIEFAAFTISRGHTTIKIQQGGAVSGHDCNFQNHDQAQGTMTINYEPIEEINKENGLIWKIGKNESDYQVCQKNGDLYNWRTDIGRISMHSPIESSDDLSTFISFIENIKLVD